MNKERVAFDYNDLEKVTGGVEFVVDSKEIIKDGTICPNCKGNTQKVIEYGHVGPFSSEKYHYECISGCGWAGLPNLY